MDPITAIGAVAASVQFADIALKSIFKTIGFLKGLEGTPGKTKELLSDVEKSVSRIHQVQQALQTTSSGSFQLLSPTQLSSLNSSINDGLRAVVTLQALLEPLVLAQNAQSGTRRLWNAIVSKKQWPEIEQHLQNIQRQDMNILRELQLSGLDVQFLLAHNLDRALATVEQSRSEAETQFEQLQCLTEEIQRETTNTSSTISRLELCSTSAVDQLRGVTADIGELDDKLATLSLTSQQMNTQVRSFRDAIVLSQGHGMARLRQSIEEESARMRKDIVGLIMPVILGQQGSLTDIQDRIEKLSQDNREKLGAQLQQELIIRPSSLKDVCDFNAQQAGQLAALSQSRHWCYCQRRKHTKSVRLGFLSVHYQSRVSHTSTCPERYSQTNSQRLGLALQLLPFLNKTVELTFGATFKSGGFQIESPLRIFATVKRSDSTMFQLFEDFPERCQAEPTGSPWLDHTWQIARNGKSEQMFTHYTWNVAVVRSELRRLRETLFDMRERRPISLNDRDEAGNTLLHEIIVLIGLLAPVYTEVKDDLDSLLTLAERCHVDIDAVAKSPRNFRRHSTVQVIGKARQMLTGDCTAGDLARDFVRMFHKQFKDFSFLSRVATFCPLDFESDIQPDPDRDGGSIPLNMRSSLLVTLQGEPWLAKYFFDDDLPKILLSHRLDDLRDILKTADLSQEYPWTIPLSALELAIDWPDGLELLSTVWTHSITPALGLASHHYEWESLKVLCKFPSPLFGNYDQLRDFVANLLRNGTILVAALKERRDQLTHFACQYFSIADQIKYGLMSDLTLDHEAHTVYNLLKKRDIPVPVAMDPGPPGSIYNSIAAIYADPSFEFPSINCVMLLDHLHCLGFRSIDERNPLSYELETLLYGYHDESMKIPAYTPLEVILRRTRMKNSLWAVMCAWFLRMGARSCWEPDVGAPNILFGVAGALAGYNEERFVRYHDEKTIRLLIEYSASLYSPLATDECDCFCSSEGCLSIHYILHNTAYTTQYRCHLHQGYRMWYWMRACDITGSDREYYLEEAVRFELFNRLEMTHTCCLGSRKLDAKERLRIQQESAEEKAQLDLLMQVYRASRDNRRRAPENSCLLSACDCPEDEVTWQKFYYSIGDLFLHWDSWWDKTKQILPVDLTLVSTPDFMVHRDRIMDYQRLALRRRGYEGLDFQTVIEQHFEQELRLEESPQTPEPKLAFTPRAREELLDEALMRACIDADFEPWDWLVESWIGRVDDQPNQSKEDNDDGREVDSPSC